MPRELVELSRAECLALLAEGDFGRVVVAGLGAQVPVIRPVNYRFDPATQSVVFRTSGGSKFHSLAHSRRACFEIDGHDRRTRSGWSVIVIGTVEVVTREAEVERLSRLGTPTWPEGARSYWVRLRARTVSGRRLAPVGDPV